MQVIESSDGKVTVEMSNEEAIALAAAAKELSEGVGSWDPRVFARIADVLGTYDNYLSAAGLPPYDHEFSDRTRNTLPDTVHGHLPR